MEIQTHIGLQQGLTKCKNLPDFKGLQVVELCLKRRYGLTGCLLAYCNFALHYYKNRFTSDRRWAFGHWAGLAGHVFFLMSIALYYDIIDIFNFNLMVMSYWKIENSEKLCATRYACLLNFLCDLSRARFGQLACHFLPRYPSNEIKVNVL